MQIPSGYEYIDIQAPCVCCKREKEMRNNGNGFY